MERRNIDEPFERLLEPQTPSRFWQPAGPPNVADPYSALLQVLDEARRKGIFALLATGFYGWRPPARKLPTWSAPEPPRTLAGALTSTDRTDTHNPPGELRPRHRPAIVPPLG